MVDRRETATRKGRYGGGAKSGSKERGPGEQAPHQLELRNVVGVANICFAGTRVCVLTH